MSTRADSFDTYRPADRVSDSKPVDKGNPLHDQAMGDLYGFHGGSGTPRTERVSDKPTDKPGDKPGTNYDYHGGGSDRVDPRPDRASDKNFFEVVRNPSGEIDRINFADGVSMRRTGPKEWELYKNEAKLGGAELQAFCGSNALGFPLCPKDGKILGSIRQKPGEDLYYDARNTELNIFATRKVDGGRDIRNYNDYSRTRLGADASLPPIVDFWDGYQWRKGAKQPLQGGGVQVTFDPNEPRPANSSKPWPRAIVRDAGADSLTVQHNNQLVMQAMWREQRLVTRTGQGPSVQEDTKFYDGESWRHGRTVVMTGGITGGDTGGPQQQPNLRRIEFTDGTGPQAVIIDITTGEIRERLGRMEQREELPVVPRQQCGPRGCTPVDRTSDRGYQPQPRYVQPQPRYYYPQPQYSYGNRGGCTPRG